MFWIGPVPVPQRKNKESNLLKIFYLILFIYHCCSNSLLWQLFHQNFVIKEKIIFFIIKCCWWFSHVYLGIQHIFLWSLWISFFTKFEKPLVKTCRWDTIFLSNLWIIFKQFNFAKTHANTRWRETISMGSLWITLCKQFQFEKLHENTLERETIFSESVWIRLLSSVKFPSSTNTWIMPEDILAKTLWK